MHFFNYKVIISIKISLKFVHKGPINNIPALGQIISWCRPGDKPLFEPMMVGLPKHASLGLNELSIGIRVVWGKTQTADSCCVRLPTLEELAPGVSHLDDLWLMDYTIRMTYDVALCHPDNIT